MIKISSKTYSVKDGNFKWSFILNDNGVSIPGLYEEKLLFKNSALKKVKSFYKAIGEFLEEIEEKAIEEKEEEKQIENIFPEYWIVKNSIYFMAKFREISGENWIGDASYYGYDGTFRGYNSISQFENNPVLITEEQFFNHFGR